MGNLKNKGIGRAVASKHLSKGQRLGWAHASDSDSALFKPVKISAGVKLFTYTTGPYSQNKLVP